MNIWNQSSSGELGQVVLFSFLELLVLADFRVRIESHLNPNCCSRSLLKAVSLNSLCTGMVGVSSHRLLKAFSYIDTRKLQAVSRLDA